MGIRHIEVAEVSCQQCDTTILVREWKDAREQGWAVPGDGQLQLCPECVAKQHASLTAAAIQKKLLDVLDDAKNLAKGLYHATI